MCVPWIHMERKKRPLRGAQCSQCRPLCRSIFCSSFASLTHGTVCICFLVELPNCDSQRGFRMLLFDVLTLSLYYCLNISYRESRALAVSVLLDLFVSDLHMFVVAVVKPQLLVSLTVIIRHEELTLKALSPSVVWIRIHRFTVVRVC